MEIYVSGHYMPSWFGRGHLYLCFFMNREYIFHYLTHASLIYTALYLPIEPPLIGIMYNLGLSRVMIWAYPSLFTEPKSTKMYNQKGNHNEYPIVLPHTEIRNVLTSCCFRADELGTSQTKLQQYWCWYKWW